MINKPMTVTIIAKPIKNLVGYDLELHGWELLSEEAIKPFWSSKEEDEAWNDL